MKEETILDFAAFQLSPKKSRFELYLCGDGETEKYGPGTLQPLLLHLPASQDVFTGSKHVLKLALPEHEPSASWFSKGTVTRFICLADNPEILEEVNTIHDEITQLETARSFNVMLHSQRKEDCYRLLQTTEVHDSEDSSLAITQIAAADATRNDLLRAMEARLMTLSQELDAALGHASARGFSVTEAANLMQFSQRFGATRLRDACAKFIASHHHQQRHDAQSTAQHKTTLSQQSAASTSTSTSTQTQIQTQTQSQSMDMDDEKEEENISIHDNDDDSSTKQDNSWALSSSLCWRSKGRGSSPLRRACTSNSNTNASLFKTRPTPNTSTSASSNSKNKRDTDTFTTTITSMFLPHTTTSDSHSQSSAQKKQQQEEEEDCDKSQDRDPIPSSRSRSSSRRLSVHDAVSIFERKQSLDQKQQQQQRCGYWRNSRLQNKSMIAETEKVKRPTRSYNDNNNTNTAAATMHKWNRGSCGTGEMVSFSYGIDAAMQSMNEDDDADYRQKIQIGQAGQKAATDVSSSFAIATSMHQTCQSWHQADCQLTATLPPSHNGRGVAMNNDISLNFLRKDDDELCSLPVSATHADMDIRYSQEVNYPTLLGKLSGSQSCTGEGQNGLSRRQRIESKMQQMLVTTVNNNNNSNSHSKDGGASSETQRRSNQMKGRFYDEYRQRREAKIREKHAGVRAEKQARLKAMHETLQKREAEMMLASSDKHANVSQRPTPPLKSSSQTREPKPKKKMEQDVIINDLKNIINQQEGNINRVAAGNYQNDRTSTTSLSAPEPTCSKKTKSKLSPFKHGTVPPLSSSTSAAAKTVMPRVSINKNSSTTSKTKSANSMPLPRSALASVPEKFLRHSGPLCSASSAMPMSMSSSSRQSSSSRSLNASANRVGRRASSSQSQHMSASMTCAASSTVKQGVKTRDKPFKKNSSSATQSETRNPRTFKKSSATKKSTVVPLEQKADDSKDAQVEDVHVDHASFIAAAAAAVDTTLDFSSPTDGAGEFKTDATLVDEPLNSQGFGEVHDHPGGSRIIENKDTHEQKDFVPDSTEIVPILKEEELPIENIKHIPLIPEDAAHTNLLSRVESPTIPISISGGTTHNQDDPSVTSSVLLETPTLVESDSRSRPSGSVDIVGKETACKKTLNLHSKHSLSQMRISSSSEAVVDEAIKKQEITRKPEIVSPVQTLKDAPKGFKRFLKFGKKRQGEPVVAALASASASASASAILESQNDEKAYAGQTASCSNHFKNVNAVEECFSDKKHIQVVPSASSKDSAGSGLSLLKVPRSFFLATFKNKSNNSKSR